MIAEKTVLAIIPARGGSKGIPGKNLLETAGKPLIAWTIDAAQKSKYIDRLILSSDDPEIIRAARQRGCEAPFIRPLELATDDASVMEVIQHAIRELPERYDFLVLLQPTSPLRTAADIDGCLDYCVAHAAPACVSVCETPKSPYWMFEVSPAGRMTPLLSRQLSQRQKQPRTYMLNGAVYVAQTAWFQENNCLVTDETLAYIMPYERSLDIDTELDVILFKALVRDTLGES